MSKLVEKNNVDQADELKQLFQEIEGTQSNPFNEYNDDEPFIDVLNLPPRREVHNDKQTFLRFSINKAFIRFLFVLLLIVGIIYLLFSMNDVNLFDLFNTAFTFNSDFHYNNNFMNQNIF